MTKPVRTTVFLCCLFTVSGTSGCFSYHGTASKPMANEPLASEAWPQFVAEPLIPLLDTPEVIIRANIDAEKLPKHLKEQGAAAADALQERYIDDLIYMNRDPHGLMRAWRPRVAEDIEPPMTNDRMRSFSRNGQYLTGPAALLEAERIRVERDIRGPDPLDGFASLFGFSPTKARSEWLLDGGIRLGLPDEVAEDAPALVIHLTSLYENKYEHAVTDRLRQHGYAIAYLDTHVSIDGPNEAEVELANARRSARVREHLAEMDRDGAADDTASERIGKLSRASDLALAEVPTVEDGLQIHPGTDLPAHAAYIAERIDARLAEHAYAMEAVVRACDALHPSLADRRVVVIGFSAGALAAPTGAARLAQAFPNRRVLLVLIGGGADLLAISQHNKFTNAGINFNPIDGAEPSDAQRATVHEHYRRLTLLDPLVVAPALRDIPVLHIYADKDTIVPTAAAERFNAAHGSVDRLVHKGDHDTLFYFLNSQASRIRSWLREQGVE